MAHPVARGAPGAWCPPAAVPSALASFPRLPQASGGHTMDPGGVPHHAWAVTGWAVASVPEQDSDWWFLVWLVESTVGPGAFQLPVAIPGHLCSQKSQGHRGTQPPRLVRSLSPLLASTSGSSGLGRWHTGVMRPSCSLWENHTAPAPCTRRQSTCRESSERSLSARVREQSPLRPGRGGADTMAAQTWGHTLNVGWGPAGTSKA